MGVFFRRADSSALGLAAPATFSWARLMVAFVLLASMVIGAIFTAGEASLSQLHSVLVHSFELVLGATIGILTAEAATS